MAGDAVAGDAGVLQLLFRHSPVPQLVSSMDGAIIAANPAYASFVGRSVDETVGMRPADVVHPEDLPALVEQGAELARGLTQTLELELRVRNAAGDWRWCLTTSSLAAQGDGQHVFVSQLVDITRRRETERRLAMTESRFRLLAGSLPVGVQQRDRSGRLVYVNRAWCDITGVREAEALGSDHIEIVHPDDREHVLEASRRLAERGGSYHQQFRVVRPDGETRWVSSRAGWYPGPDGLHAGFVGSLEDITELLQAQEERNRLASIVEMTSDLVGIVDDHGYIVYVNTAARDAYGLDAFEGRVHADDVYTAESVNRFYEQVAPSLLAGQTWMGELDMVRHDGEVMRVWQALAPHIGADGKLRYISAVGRDITEQRRQTARLTHQATHDALTGLPNRAHLLDVLTQLVDTSEHDPMAVLFIDLDQLKDVNDRLGHGAGDELLRAVARRLTEVVRPSDLVARLGGDEFVVLCPEVTSEEHAREVATRMLEALTSSTFVIRGDALAVTASIGVTISTGGADRHAEALLREADAAMYVAKSLGRDRVEVFRRSE